MVRDQNLKRASVPTKQVRNVLELLHHRTKNINTKGAKIRVGVARGRLPRAKVTRAVFARYASEVNLNEWYLSAAAAWSYVLARLHLHQGFVL